MAGVARNAELRELLWFCLPALLLGLAVRTLLAIQMPYGYVQFDTGDFLTTPYRLLTDGVVVIHGKKTFLVPILYSIPFLLRLPALLFIPLAQHFLGLGFVLITGALVRLWFTWWKWLIVPITVITALNPVLLWFEQALLAESIYLFCAGGLALAGTLFFLRPTAGRLAWVLVALILTAGARPEGKLFFPFAPLLVLLACWGDWKKMGRFLAVVFAATLLVFAATRSTQAGQLLYATMLPLSPDRSRVAPEFSDWIRPLRDTVRARWGDVPKKLTTLEKELGTKAKWFLDARPDLSKKLNANQLCEKLALEAMLTQPTRLPLIAWTKFHLSMSGAAEVGFGSHALYEKQAIGFTRKKWMLGFSDRMTGQRLASQQDVAAFLRAHYRPMGWYDALDMKWRALTTQWRPRSHKMFGQTIPALPYFFRYALLGMALALVRPGRWRLFHLAWVTSLAAVWFGVMLTGVVNPRYRLLFEPFCLVYLFLLLDAAACAVAWLRSCFARKNLVVTGLEAA